MRWITIGPRQPAGISIVLYPPAATPGLTDDESAHYRRADGQGHLAPSILFATKDLDVAFARLQAAKAEIVEEPTEQPYGVRHFLVPDAAGSRQQR